MVEPRTGNGGSPRAFSCVAASIAASVGFMAVAVQHASIERAIAIAIASVLVWAVLDGVVRSEHRRGLRVIPPSVLGAVAIALSLGWEVAGVGLAPVGAVAASALAGVTSALALIVARRAKLLPSHSRVLVVGSGVVADALVVAIARDARQTIVGRIDDSDEAGLLGDLGAFDTVVASSRATIVMFAYAHARDGRLAEIAARSRELGLAVAMVPRLFEQFDQRVRARSVGGVPLLIVEPRAYQAQLPGLARIFDIATATALLLITAPIWLVLSIAIVIEEPGPVFYRAIRVGQDGRPFKMFKFRKMRRNASGPALTVSGDTRFTRIGGLLARTKLDELPQLLNVLRGEMGLVGPRPEDPSYVALFPAEFAEILRVRPGITGLSQIQFRDESALLVGDDFDELYRNELLPRKISLDRYYAARRSLALDTRILLWTVVAIVAGASVDRNELTQALRFELRDAEVATLPSDANDLAAA